jgi:hypothetical protein
MRVSLPTFGNVRCEEFTLEMGRAMSQAVSLQPLIAEAWVHARINPCGICGGQSGTGIGFGQVFSAIYSGFSCQYHSTVALQTHIMVPR